MRLLHSIRNGVVGILWILRMGWIGLTGPEAWYRNIATWCRANGRVWDIPDHLEPSETYLNRFYILPGRIGRNSNEDRLFKLFNLFIHCFRRGDADDLHDHPWYFWISIVLSVGYWEVTPTGRKWRRPGSIAFRSGLSRHKVELDPTKPPPWTLFIPGPKSRTWGFLLNRGSRWVPYWLHLFHPSLYSEWFSRRRAAQTRKAQNGRSQSCNTVRYSDS